MENRLVKLSVLGLLSLTVVACGGVPENQDTIDEDRVDPTLAIQITKTKMDSLGGDVGVPTFAKCGTPGSTSSAERVNNAAYTGAAQQRNGSSKSCKAVGALQPTDDALYYCWTRENPQYTWTYLKNIRTGVQGWTRDDLLRGNGSSRPCGF